MKLLNLILLTLLYALTGFTLTIAACKEPKKNLTVESNLIVDDEATVVLYFKPDPGDNVTTYRIEYTAYYTGVFNHKDITSDKDSIAVTLNLEIDKTYRATLYLYCNGSWQLAGSVDFDTNTFYGETVCIVGSQSCLDCPKMDNTKIGVTASQHSATITWKANLKENSPAYYTVLVDTGPKTPSASYALTNTTICLPGIYSATIGNLKPGTSYRFVIVQTCVLFNISEGSTKEGCYAQKFEISSVKEFKTTTCDFGDVLYNNDLTKFGYRPPGSEVLLYSQCGKIRIESPVDDKDGIEFVLKTFDAYMRASAIIIKPGFFADIEDGGNGSINMQGDNFDETLSSSSARTAGSESTEIFTETELAEEVGTGINLFPNPTTGIMNIQLRNPSEEIVEVLVTDIMGREVVVHGNETRIDIGHSGSGVYLYRIKTNIKIYYGRIAKN